MNLLNMPIDELQKLNEEREAEIEKASRIYYVYRNPDYSSESYRVFIAAYFDNLSQFVAELAGQSQNFDHEVGSPPTQTGSGRRDWTISVCPLSQLKNSRPC